MVTDGPEREEIVWTLGPKAAFWQIQKSLEVPACIIFPADDMKLWLKQPEMDEYLLSPNFGWRPPLTLWKQSPHDAEIIFLNKEVKNASHYIGLHEKPGIAIEEFKHICQVEQSLGMGSFLSHERVQDLFMKLLADGMSSQQTDFISWNSVECMIAMCAQCEGMNEVNTECLGKVSMGPYLHLTSAELWTGNQCSSTYLTQVASLVTTRNVIWRKEKNLCVAPCSNTKKEWWMIQTHGFSMWEGQIGKGTMANTGWPRLGWKLMVWGCQSNNSSTPGPLNWGWPGVTHGREAVVFQDLRG